MYFQMIKLKNKIKKIIKSLRPVIWDRDKLT